MEKTPRAVWEGEGGESWPGHEAVEGGWKGRISSVIKWSRRFLAQKEPRVRTRRISLVVNTQKMSAKD